MNDPLTEPRPRGVEGRVRSGEAGFAVLAPLVSDHSAVRTSTPWPAAPAEQLVGLTGLGPTFEAGLAWLDVAERHFVPGVLPIGRGVVRALAPDEAGRVWALLPWSGEIVRVGP